MLPAVHISRPDGLHRDPLPVNDLSIPALNYQCFVSLTKIRQNAPKIAQCFLSLTDHVTRNYLYFVSLTKKGGSRVARFLRPDALGREGEDNS